jgi:hypothetical protein
LFFAELLPSCLPDFRLRQLLSAPKPCCSFVSQSEPPCRAGKATICALRTARFPRRTRLLATAPLQNALSRTLPALLFRWFS